MSLKNCGFLSFVFFFFFGLDAIARSSLYSFHFSYFSSKYYCRKWGFCFTRRHFLNRIEDTSQGLRCTHSIFLWLSFLLCLDGWRGQDSLHIQLYFYHRSSLIVYKWNDRQVENKKRNKKKHQEECREPIQIICATTSFFFVRWKEEEKKW